MAPLTRIPAAFDLLHDIVGNGQGASRHARMNGMSHPDKYTTVHTALTDAQLDRHIAGDETIAPVLIGADGLASAGLCEQDTGGLDLARRIIEGGQVCGVTMAAIVCKGSDRHDGCHPWALYADRYNPAAIHYQMQQVATLKAMRQKDVPLAVREDFRALLTEAPAIAEQYGDLPTLYQRLALGRFEQAPIMEESVKYQLAALRKTLAGDDSSALERLLIDVVLACYNDYWAFATIYQQENAKSFNLRDLERWDKLLASKEARYLRAVETLARVRRLLRLTALQVNIAAAGGQQVNVAGELAAGRSVPELPG